MALVELRDIAFHYPDSTNLILDGISLSADAGDVIAIAGRNGSGKSTLLKLVAGELHPTSGTMSRARSIRAIYLDQFAGEMLAPSLTIIEHVLACHHRSDQGANPAIRDELKRFLAPFGLSLESRLDDFAGELSGGQRQILALAAALLSNVLVLCLDEFTSNLDHVSEHAALVALESFRQNREVVIFLVAHRMLGLHVSMEVGLSSGKRD